MISKLLIKLNVSQNKYIDVLNAFKKAIPFANLPLSVSNRINHNENFSNIDKYIERNVPILEFDVCSAKDCKGVVYVGKYQSRLICPYCKQARFRDCVKKKCKNTATNCTHKRIPYEKLQYRSITSILFYLLSFKEFYELINIDHCNTFMETMDDSYWDVTTSEIYKDKMNQMHRSFLRHKNLIQDINKRNNIKEVSLCGGQNFDGQQIYKHLTSQFIPLLFHFKNFPPSLRRKVNLGILCLSIFSGDSKQSNVLNFLYDKLFIAELEHYSSHDGIGGVECEINNEWYFIQISLIWIGLDSKAVEPKLNVKLNNSYAGTAFILIIIIIFFLLLLLFVNVIIFLHLYISQTYNNYLYYIGCCKCHSGAGQRIDQTAIRYFGYRGILPRTHFLKFLGQARMCCPKRFYSERIINSYEYANEYFNTNSLSDPTILDGDGEHRNFFDVAKWVRKMKQCECKSEWTPRTLL
jgi:hypothetical protein